MSQLLNTVFLKDYYQDLGAIFAPFSGYLMPINFSTGIIREHNHTRSKCGIFDVSHMGQMLILVNKENIDKLETIIPRNLHKLPLFKCVYSFILNNKGGIVDDIIVSKIEIDSIEFLLLIYNASRKKIDEEILTNLISDLKIIKNCSLIALQGPSSSLVLNEIFPLSNKLYYMENSRFIFNNENIFISRSGYTGEDGFEILVPNSQIKNFVKKLFNHQDTIPCGLGCRDTLRLEAGLCLYGNELNETISPIEANLKWAISQSRLKQDDFFGYKRIIQEIQSGTNHIRIGIKSISKSILRKNMILADNNGNKIGKITSGGFSPSLNISIGMAYIKNNYLKESNEIYCFIRDKLEIVKISNLPFLKHNYKRKKNENT